MEIILPELTPTEQFAEDDLNAWTPTEMEVPSVEEISDESENEVEILAIKPPPRLLTASEEVLKMKEEGEKRISISGTRSPSSGRCQSEKDSARDSQPDASGKEDSQEKHSKCNPGSGFLKLF